MPLLPVIGKIVLLVLLPIVVGQSRAPSLRSPVGRPATTGDIKLADRAIILAIVCNSFSDSMVEGVCAGPRRLADRRDHRRRHRAVLPRLLPDDDPCRLLGFNRADTVACLFCASKKSLATGVPLAPIIFGANPSLGLIIAPLMLYPLLPSW